jgi:hypothetical protein
MTIATCCWRRIDRPGLEILQLRQGGDGVEGHASIIDAGAGQFSLQAVWKLDSAWRCHSLELRQERRGEAKALLIERGQQDWRVDGQTRPDLSDCLEIDVSATPFCNSLALRALGHRSGELTALYVDASDLTMQPSRQRYERLSERRWRYVDLGVAKGFEAVLDFDANGLVERYPGLFERV